MTASVRYLAQLPPKQRPNPAKAYPVIQTNEFCGGFRPRRLDNEAHWI